MEGKKYRITFYAHSDVCRSTVPVRSTRHLNDPAPQGPFSRMWRSIQESIPDNHNFNQSRKTKIVMGKKNAWPLPKSKGNRF